MSYAAAYGNSGIALNRLKSIYGGEVKNGILGKRGICVGILVGYLNGCSLAAVGEYYLILACCGVINCAGVNGIIGDGAYGIVGIVSLYFNAIKRDLVACCVVGIHTRNLDLGKSGSCGSLLIGIDDDGVEIAVTNRHYNNLGLLCEVLRKRSCCGTNTVDGEVLIARECLYGYLAACGNGELNKCALLHIKSVGVLVPSNVAVLCADMEACPIKSSAA